MLKRLVQVVKNNLPVDDEFDPFHDVEEDEWDGNDGDDSIHGEAKENG
jgi:hypothetical protein